METVLLTCGYCGARIQLSDESLDTRVCTCQYCRSTVLIPEDRTRIESWYNRAEFHRRNCDFDKAIETYEQILKENDQDPVAHWGMALSKFGIEYVDDPVTRELVPTCHRTREQTILSDPEYNAALDCADESSKKVLKQEAKRIHEIQKKILSISKQEQPYDVFISYKEEDEQKNRTKDSVLAQQIYDELTKKNYRVFYARKTLEGKLGTEYEPIIYAALSSAKVMVVVGTKPEHFKATWVRNEWRRFQLMGKEGGKTIIPAYRDMYPDELPPELSTLTALDMEKIGFMQELTDGIGRCLGENASVTAEGNEGFGRERLAKNGSTFLDLGKTEKAKANFEQMTETYPEDYRGWWGLLECETDRFRMSAADRMEQLADWYTTAVKTAPTEKRVELQDQFFNYLRGIAQDLARLEVDRKRGDMRKNREAQQELEQKMVEPRAFVAQRVPAILQENLSSAEYDDKRFKDGIREQEQESKFGRDVIAAVICGVLAFACFAASGLWILLGLGFTALFFLLLAMALSSWSHREDYKKEIERLNRLVSETWDKKRKKDDAVKKKEEEARNSIAQAETELEQLRNELQAMEKYCARPIRELAEEQYQQYTSEFGRMIKGGSCM